MDTFISRLLAYILPVIIFVLVGYIIALFIKKRSIIAGVSFYFLLSSLCLLLININDGKFILDLSNFVKDYSLGNSLVILISIIAYPLSLFHNSFMQIIIKDLNASNDVISFFDSYYFTLVINALFFMVSFILFKKRKKDKRNYSDYDY